MNRPRLGHCTLLALWLGAVTPPGAMAARWLDKLPADDPEMTVRRGATTLNAAPAPTLPDQPEEASLPVSIASSAFGAASGLVWGVASGIGAISYGISEALWETAYMFGFNSTPVPRVALHDPVPDLAKPIDDPVQPQAATRTAAAPAKSDKPAAAVPVATAAAAAAAPAPTPPAAIDPGLLANFIFDRGSRRPDGSFFVPKSLQRLFNVRTARATASEVPVTMQLAGRIVPDRQTEGDVEAALLGRIQPPESGLPVLGDAVTKGQVLAYVVPAVGVVDRTQVRREVARLTTEIRVETENLEILKQFSFVPFRDGKIYQAEQRLAGLRREREALLPLLETREVLRAETDGVISVANAIAGQIVHPGDLVFQIVNPKRLWVEVAAPDPTTAASAQRVVSATALTPEGQTLTLSYVGSGLALQQQSTPILFRIDNPPDGLRVGRPVTVAVTSADKSQRGLPLTRDALTIGADGVQEVWEQSEPEVFLPRAVRTRDLDGRNVLVVDGLKEGSRVVVTGVRLLAQLQ